MSRRGKASNPVSLFSFQDIITSVTGIMLLITLMLAVELVKRREQSPRHRTQAVSKEIDEAVKKTADVQAAARQARQDLADLRAAFSTEQKSLQESAKIDPEQLARRLRDLETLTRDMEAELAASKARREQAESQLDKLAEKQADREAASLTLEEITQRLKEKQEEIRRMRESNRVIYNAGAGAGKTAWIVELAADGVTAAESGKQESPLKFAGTREFLNWAGKRNSAREYFVLLVKPKTIDDFLAARTVLTDRNFDLGFDLLADDQSALDSSLGAAAP